MRCRVLQVEPDAEAIVLAEPVSGQRFALPLVTFKRDGQTAAAFEPLTGHDVWLSVRLG
jgi:predicted P-loop ATPase/GTPase